MVNAIAHRLNRAKIFCDVWLRVQPGWQMMNPSVDYHMHTPLCGHANGEPDAYARQAVAVGLIEIGFSDHAPLLSHKDPTVTMDHAQIPAYHAMIESVRDKFAGTLKVRVGIEADFLPGYEDRTRELLKGYPYDYVIGSVHFMAGWGFDDPSQIHEWDQRDINKIYREYYRLVRDSARTRLFDIVGHADLVKKFGFYPTEDMHKEVEENARVFAETGVVIELNTAGLRRPVKEIFPSQRDLEIYYRYHVPITFGSDAHRPADVARDFAEARKLALAAGYTEYVLFKARKIVRTLPL
jgi:histidinol-phosphatase (PHP family)